jgi:hypothetical protein
LLRTTLHRMLPPNHYKVCEQDPGLVLVREGEEAVVVLVSALKAFFCFVLASKKLSTLLFEFAVVLLV